MTSSAQTPKPTDERDFWAGIAINRGVGIADAYDIADALLVHHARALAAAVTAEREKVAAVALQLECHAEAHRARAKDARTLGHASTAGMERVRTETLLDAARRIREVSR